MATTLLSLYSQQHWLADGATIDWNFTFADGYISTAYVKAYKVSPSGTRTEITVTSGMFIGPFQLRISPAVEDGYRLVVYRDTPKNARLVDFAGGARVDEISLDLIAKQATHIAAEVLDGARVDFAGDDVGFRSLNHNDYTTASTILVDDNGKAHYKSDGTGVVVPDTLPVGFITSIINDNAAAMTVSFTGETAYVQGGTASGVTFALQPYQVLTITKVAATRWFISGFVL